MKKRRRVYYSVFLVILSVLVLYRIFHYSEISLKKRQADSAPSSNSRLVFYTEEYAPLNYSENGQAAGFSVDLLLRLFETMKEPYTVSDIKVVPWARGYQTVTSTENTVLFSTVRNSQREKDFSWVGPFGKTENILVAKKSGKAREGSFISLHDFRFGAVRKDIGEELLLQHGLPDANIEKADSLSENINKLSFNRIDIISCEKYSFLYYLKKMNLDVNDYRIVYSFGSTDVYFAFNKNTDPSVTQRYRNALERFIHTEEYRKLRQHYFGY